MPFKGTWVFLVGPADDAVETSRWRLVKPLAVTPTTLLKADWRLDSSCERFSDDVGKRSSTSLRRNTRPLATVANTVLRHSLPFTVVVVHEPARIHAATTTTGWNKNEHFQWLVLLTIGFQDEAILQGCIVDQGASNVLADGRDDVGRDVGNVALCLRLALDEGLEGHEQLKLDVVGVVARVQFFGHEGHKHAEKPGRLVLVVDHKRVHGVEEHSLVCRA